MSDLASAYVKYAASKQLKCDVLYSSDSHITLGIRGRNVLTFFENEPGKHVVQRVPPTESKGRRHTSVISVAVVPIIETDFNISDGEIEIQTQRGHGKGGQHQNKTDSAVRAKHAPTGITVFINGRDQHQNKKQAIRILKSRIVQMKEENQLLNLSNQRVQQMGRGKRSGKTRTYNFIDSRVVDHILGTKTRRINDIMKGRFDILFSAKK